MLSLNIFPPARIQIGILIREGLNFERCGQSLPRDKVSLGFWGNVMLFLSELPPSREQLELILHKLKPKKSKLFTELLWPYQADVRDPACGVGLNCRKSPVLHIRSRGRPPGGSHTGAGWEPRSPQESGAPAVTGWTLPMVPWP